jgi:hypothetical protein
MKLGMKIASLTLLAVLVILPLQTVAAAGQAQNGQLVLGQSFTLNSGETMNGDLLVLGGSATLEQGATLNGDVAVLGGVLTIAGQVNGNAAVFGGGAELASTAHITGNLSVIGSTLVRTAGSLVDGQVFNSATAAPQSATSAQPLPGSPIVVLPGAVRGSLAPLWSALAALVRSLALALMAMLVMLFLAPHAQRVAQAAVDQPLIAGGVGLITLLLAPVALLLMVLTILLIPIAALAVIALLVAGLFGWIAIGLEIGQRFSRAVHQEWHPALSAGVGTFVLTLVAAALTSIPVVACIGWLLPFLVGLVALGAVGMTRFGTRAVTPVRAQSAPPPAVPSSAEPVSLPPSPPEMEETEPKPRKQA